jgi:hypothetical protein
MGIIFQAFTYSMKHKMPLIAFCQDRCLTLFEHPSVDCLHTIYHEPKVLFYCRYHLFFKKKRGFWKVHVFLRRLNFFLQAEIIPSIEELLNTAEIQVGLYTYGCVHLNTGVIVTWIINYFPSFF